MPPIYEPAEDSYLMSEAMDSEIPRLLKRNPELNLLEIGVGSGINLITALNSGVKKENITGCDINEEAVEHCKKLGFNCIKSDLFSNIQGKHDVIIFNPPYLPLDKKEPENSRAATTAGKKGNEIIVRFLEQAKNYLNKNGRVFVITSSLSESVNFIKLGYKSKAVSSAKLFFEKLSLWECLKI